MLIKNSGLHKQKLRTPMALTMCKQKIEVIKAWLVESFLRINIEKSMAGIYSFRLWKPREDVVRVASMHAAPFSLFSFHPARTRTVYC